MGPRRAAESAQMRQTAIDHELSDVEMRLRNLERVQRDLVREKQKLRDAEIKSIKCQEREESILEEIAFIERELEKLEGGTSGHVAGGDESLILKDDDDDDEDEDERRAAAAAGVVRALDVDDALHLIRKHWNDAGASEIHPDTRRAVKADGDCQFETIARAVNASKYTRIRTSPITAVDVRNKVLDHIGQHRDRFCAFVLPRTESDTKKSSTKLCDDYLHVMRKPRSRKSWGDELTIQAASEVYGIAFVVINQANNDDSVLVVTRMDSDIEPDEFCIVYYRDALNDEGQSHNGHYQVTPYPPFLKASSHKRARI